MEARLEQWIEGIHASSKLFQEKFSGLDKEALNWKPNPNDWSIGQNIHHLIQISSSFYPKIDQLLAGQYKKPFLGRIKFIVNFFERIVLKAVEPHNPKKTRTFPVWEPSQSNIDADILDQFLKEQDRVIEMFKKCEGYIGTGIVISSPASANLVYSLESAFDIIVVHQKRHFLQAERVLAARNTLHSHS